jgi:predicted nucleic acid-binding protein
MKIMKAVFADSQYWIAVVRPHDPWKHAACEARLRLGEVMLATTDEVLIEFLAALSKGGPAMRRVAVEMVRAILDDPGVRVVPQTHDGFLAGLARFANRVDKQYSLTDCISMNVMEADGIDDVLTNDSHFEQEGFNVLLKV